MAAELDAFKERMIKTTEVLATQFASVRAGRANAAVLDQISVDYYGVPTPIRQIASVSSPDARTLLIQPWDASALKGIEKAILTSELGINPQNDGRSIRLVFPQLTEERRKDLAKQVRKYGEEGKVAIRNIRRDAMEKFKKQQKKTEITEDDLKLLWQAILNMFENDRSAARGKMAVRKLIVFRHDSELGNAPAWKLFELVHVDRAEGVSEPRSYGDYVVTVDEANLPEGVRCEVMG